MPSGPPLPWPPPRRDHRRAPRGTEGARCTGRTPLHTPHTSSSSQPFNDAHPHPSRPRVPGGRGGRGGPKRPREGTGRQPEPRGWGAGGRCGRWGETGGGWIPSSQACEALRGAEGGVVGGRGPGAGPACGPSSPRPRPRPQARPQPLAIPWHRPQRPSHPATRNTPPTFGPGPPAPSLRRTCPPSPADHRPFGPQPRGPRSACPGHQPDGPTAGGLRPPRWRRAPRSVTPRQPRPRRRGGGRHPGPKSRSGHSKTHHRHSLRAWARAPRTHAGTRPRGGSADGQEWERNGIPDTVAAGTAAARAPDAAPGPAPLRRGGCLAPTGRVAQLRVPVSSFRLSVCVCVVGTCVCVPACATMGSGGAGGPGLALSQAG